MQSISNLDAAHHFKYHCSPFELIIVVITASKQPSILFTLIGIQFVLLLSNLFYWLSLFQIIPWRALNVTTLNFKIAAMNFFTAPSTVMIVISIADIQIISSLFINIAVIQIISTLFINIADIQIISSLFINIAAIQIISTLFINIAVI